MDTTITMTRAERLLFAEIQSLHRKVDEIIEAKVFESIEEISMHKAAKLLRIGEEKLTLLVTTKKLKAITYKDKNHKVHYRFRVADIRQYQKKRTTKQPEEREVHVISPVEALAKKIFEGGDN